MQLNASKTQAIIIGSSHNIKKIDHAQLQPVFVDNKLIPSSESLKNLGLTLNSTLRWDEQLTP